MPDQPGPPTRLAPWVVLHEEVCRGGRVLRLAVNRRDGCALDLTDEEWQLCQSLAQGTGPPDALPEELLEDLTAGGFLDGVTSEEVTAPSPGFLRTLDLRWSGADRLVQAAYRRVHKAFSRPALLVQGVLAVAGLAALVHALMAQGHVEIAVSPAGVPFVLGLALTAIVIHELAHGLVLAHCGRRVNAGGARLHLGTPAFYVESVDAMLLTRRQRIAQAAAGPWAEWLVTSVAGLVLWFAPAGSLTPLLHRFVVLNSLTVVTNLLPFVGLDGSWILGDLLRIPDLSRRSRTVVAELFANRRRPTTAEEWGLAVYAAVNAVVATALLVVAAVFWWALFGSSAQHLAAAGPLGWMALGVIGWMLTRPLFYALGQGNVSLLAFRPDRSWRVRATYALHDRALRDADDDQLGEIAGLLQRHRLGPAPSLASEPSYLVVLRGRLRHEGQIHGAGAVLRVSATEPVAAERRAVVASLTCSAAAA